MTVVRAGKFTMCIVAFAMSGDNSVFKGITGVEGNLKEFQDLNALLKKYPRISTLQRERHGGGAMIQATIPTFIPDIIQQHRYKYMPHCSGCGDQFTETGFLALEQTGSNVVWETELARCPICGGQVEAWRHPVQSWRRR